MHYVLKVFGKNGPEEVWNFLCISDLGKKNHILRKLLLAYRCCPVNRAALQNYYQSFISEKLLGMMLEGWNSSTSSTSSYMQNSENICITDDLVSALFLK